MKISILTLSSSEIVTGKNNFALSTIRSALYKNGQEVVCSLIVKPVSNIVINSLNFALQNSDCVLLLCENGLDKPYMAKKIICDKFGCKLIQSVFAKKNIDDFAKNKNVPLMREDMAFAQMPEIARTIKNPLGVFQGCLCEKDGKTLFLLPLSHSELTHMFFASVLPYILQFKGNNSKTYVLKTFGISLLEMHLILKDYIANKHNIEIVCNEYLKLGEIIVNIPKGVRNDLADKFVQEVYSKVLPYVYSDKDESEAEFISTILSLHKQTICFAEDFTSGNMTLKLFAGECDASKVLKFSYITPTPQSKISTLNVPSELFKKPTLDYEEIAYQMVLGALKQSGADVAVSTCGDVEAGKVYFAIGSMDGVHVFCEQVEGSTEQKINMATNAIFFKLIKKLKLNDFALGRTIL